MIYVDTPMNFGQWRYGRSCHMIADSHEELMAFAAKIGMRPEWLQTNPVEHFDLTEKRRALAVRLGASEVDWREMARLTRARREVKA